MKRLCLWMIRMYQKHISSKTPPRCRFYPTCSHYTYTAIERFGVVRGILMGFWRILRCNPFCRGGYDPVPEKKVRKKNPRIKFFWYEIVCMGNIEMSKNHLSDWRSFSKDGCSV